MCDLRTILTALLAGCFCLPLVSCNEEEVNALKEQNGVLQQKHEALKSENTSLNEKLTAATENISELEKSLAEKTAEEKDLTDKFNTSNADLAAAQNEIVKLQVEKKDKASSDFEKVLEESRIWTEKQSVSILEHKLSIESELVDIAYERADLEVKIANLEGEQFGLGRGGKLAKEKEITELKKQQLELDRDAKKAQILGGERQRLFGIAKAEGLDVGTLTGIQQALSKAVNSADFKAVAEDIDEAIKNKKVAELQEALKKKIASIEEAAKARAASEKRELERTKE